MTTSRAIRRRQEKEAQKAARSDEKQTLPVRPKVENVSLQFPWSIADAVGLTDEFLYKDLKGRKRGTRLDKMLKKMGR